MSEFRSYEEALRWLREGRQGKRQMERNVPSIKATTLRACWDSQPDSPDTAPDYLVLKQHATDIVTYHSDGTATLNSGGWRTHTTKDRLNTFTRARIHQAKGLWYVRMSSEAVRPELCVFGLFTDHLRIDCATGLPTNPELMELPGAEERWKRKLDKLVTGYINGYVKHYAELRTLTPPSGGDCWGCYFRKTGANTAGPGGADQSGWVRKEKVSEEAMGVGHYLDHMLISDEPDDEPYYVPSLAWNAMQRRGNPAACWHMAKAECERGQESGMLRDDLVYWFRQLKPRLLEEFKARNAAQKKEA